MKFCKILAAAAVVSQFSSVSAVLAETPVIPVNQTQKQPEFNTVNATSAQSQIDHMNVLEQTVRIQSQAPSVPVGSVRNMNNDFVTSDGTILSYGNDTSCGGRSTACPHAAFSVNIETLELTSQYATIAPTNSVGSGLANVKPEDRPFYWHHQVKEMIALVTQFRDQTTDPGDRALLDQWVAALSDAFASSGIVANGAGTAAAVMTQNFVIEEEVYDAQKSISQKVVVALNAASYDGTAYAAGDIGCLGLVAKKSVKPALWVSFADRVYDIIIKGRLSADPQAAQDARFIALSNASRRQIGAQDPIAVIYTDGNTAAQVSAQRYAEWIRIETVKTRPGQQYPAYLTCYLNAATGVILIPDATYGDVQSALNPSEGLSYLTKNLEIQQALEKAIPGMTDVAARKSLQDTLDLLKRTAVDAAIRIAGLQSLSPLQRAVILLRPDGRTLLGIEIWTKPSVSKAEIRTTAVRFRENGTLQDLTKFDLKGNLIEIDVYDPASQGSVPMTRDFYNAATGKRESLEGLYPDGTVKYQYLYDSRGRQQFVDGFDALGRKTYRYEFQVTTGKLETFTDYNPANGKVIRLAKYDPSGVITQMDVYDPITGKLKSRMTRNAKGQEVWKHY